MGLGMESRTGPSPSAAGRPGKWRLGLAWAPHALLLVVLGMAVVWGRQMMAPGLAGFYNDDATYVDTAMALAHGHGYNVMWAPGHPVPADRYPIGFPAFLSLFVRLVPPPVERQVFAMQVGVDVLGAAFLAIAYLFITRRLKLSPWIALASVALIAVNPMFGDLSSTIMSDLPFALVFVLAWWLHHRMIERPGAGRVLAAALGIAAALLVRYAAAILPLVAVVALLRQGRWKTAAGYVVALGVVMAPWLVWVVQHHAAGYEHQWGHQLMAGRRMFFDTMGFSALYVAYLGLAALVFPQIFVGKFPARTVLAFGNPAYMTIGATATLAILGALGVLWFKGRRRRRAETADGAGRWPTAIEPGGRPGDDGLSVRDAGQMDRSLAAAVILAYLVLLVVWCSGFLYLGEFLTVRLLMPVAPAALALTLHAMASGIQGWKPAFRISGRMVVAALWLLGTGGGVLMHPRIVRDETLLDVHLLQGTCGRVFPQRFALLSE